MPKKVYLHVSNSGISFEVFNGEFGPTIRIHSATVGNLSATTEILTDVQSLADLGKMFTEASNNTFSAEYCNKASVMNAVDYKGSDV